MKKQEIKRVSDSILCINGIDCNVTLEALDILALRIWYFSEPHKKDIYINNLDTKEAVLDFLLKENP